MTEPIGKMFFKKIYNSDDVYVFKWQKDMLIFPKKIRFDVIYQQFKPIREDIPLPLQCREIKIKKNPKLFIQECMKGQNDRIYARVSGVTFTDQNIFPTLNYGPIAVWAGGR